MIRTERHHLNYRESLFRSVPHIMPNILLVAGEQQPRGIAHPEERLPVIQHAVVRNRKMEIRDIWCIGAGCRDTQDGHKETS